MTGTEARAIFARLSRDEKEMLLRLPPSEAMLILELHRLFPGAIRVDEPKELA